MERPFGDVTEKEGLAFSIISRLYDILMIALGQLLGFIVSRIAFRGLFNPICCFQGFYVDDEDQETSMYFNGQTQPSLFRERDNVSVFVFTCIIMFVC